ncbi:MAG: hypothetical protein ABSF54_26390 [Bryobacteraceae bacterium]|jgi:hypothetical protein
MKWKLLAPAAMLFAVAAPAADDAGRGSINGEWQLEAGAGKGSGASWILESKNDEIHVTQLQNGQKMADFDCNTLGRECEAKDSGRHAKVSFYFNGSKLVELETRGSEVLKRRFSVGDQGDLMEVELIPVVPEGKPAVERFKRVPVSTAGK